MSSETTKSISRRLSDPCYREVYFVGQGIDIGAGPDGLSKQLHHFPRITSCRDWDLEDGDAQEMAGVEDETYDFVHSSHCLEHMRNPFNALHNWLRILKPGGHLVAMVPDEELYEQGVWPPTFNTDHKHSFRTYRHGQLAESVNVLAMLLEREVVKIERLHLGHPLYAGTADRFDYTQSPFIESAIEFVLRKPRESLNGAA